MHDYGLTIHPSWRWPKRPVPSPRWLAHLSAARLAHLDHSKYETEIALKLAHIAFCEALRRLDKPPYDPWHYDHPAAD